MKQIVQNTRKIERGKNAQIESFSHVSYPFQVKISCYQKSKKYCKQGRWTIKEKVKFCAFLSYHKIMFTRDFNRRFFKIFKFMSNFIKTRNPNQCRSHHQKIYRQYPSFNSYINKIKKTVSTKVFQSYLNLYDEELRQLGQVMGMQQQFQDGQQEQLIINQKEPQIKIEENNSEQNKKNQAQNKFYQFNFIRQHDQCKDDKKDQDLQKTGLPKCLQFVQNYTNNQSFDTGNKEFCFQNISQLNYQFYESRRNILIQNCNNLWKQYIMSCLELQELERMKYFC